MNAPKSKRGLALRLAIAVCSAAAAVSGILLLSDWFGERSGADTYAGLAQYLAPPPQTQDTAPPAGTRTDTHTDTPVDAQAGIAEQSQTPGGGDTAGETEQDYWPVVDFDGLRKINGDIVAWIISPGTNVNYPVVQGADNDFYLTHLFTGEPGKAGAIFMDCRNSPDFSHRNTIIYGHHLRGGAMFRTITQYKSQSYFGSHPAIRLITPDGRFEIQVVASYVASVQDDAWRVGFGDGEAFLAWVGEARAKSDVISSAEVAETDRVVTLSTCTYEFANARYIVLGKLAAAE